MTAPTAGSSRVPPVGSVTHSRLDSANATTLASRSVAKPTMPPPPSRLRSRRARSAGDSCSSPPASRVRGSASSVSVPLATSSDHSAPTGSVPCAERTNSSRSPVGSRCSDRGAPRVNFWVRALARGNESGVVSAMPANLPSDVVVAGRGWSRTGAPPVGSQA